MSNDWKDEALRRRNQQIDAIAEAHVDAGNFGRGWIMVDIHGNLRRIDPKFIIINLSTDEPNDQ